MTHRPPTLTQRIRSALGHESSQPTPASTRRSLSETAGAGAAKGSEFAERLRRAIAATH